MKNNVYLHNRFVKFKIFIFKIESFFFDHRNVFYPIRISLGKVHFRILYELKKVYANIIYEKIEMRKIIVVTQ